MLEAFNHSSLCLLRSSDGREVSQHSQAGALWGFLGLSSHTRPRVLHSTQGWAGRGAALPGGRQEEAPDRSWNMSLASQPLLLKTGIPLGFLFLP